mmetsp:Transcript_2829/g.7766  ORF Transcript_2829/g.7766 Transcript_2829/m.7766 type:complete len:135 (+) Transcript_2829:701-1105(+)
MGRQDPLRPEGSAAAEHPPDRHEEPGAVPIPGRLPGGLRDDEGRLLPPAQVEAGPPQAIPAPALIIGAGAPHRTALSASQRVASRGRRKERTKQAGGHRNHLAMTAGGGSREIRSNGRGKKKKTDKKSGANVLM